MARAGKVLYLAMIVGRRKPGDHRLRECVFSKLEAAQQWCVKHATERRCSAEVVLGTTAGGRVLWRYKGTTREEARDPTQPPPSVEELRIDGPADPEVGAEPSI